jgi:hypothetical protein
MKHFNRSRKWISIFVLIAVLMTSSIAGISLFSPAKVQACGDEGLSPGWWKNHTDLWGGRFYPNYPVRWIFTGVYGYSLKNVTMIEALKFPGGSGIDGSARILLRAAVAAALNIYCGYVYYPESLTNVEIMVTQALESRNRQTMLDLAAQLDAWNNLGVPDLEARLNTP